jgi:hypothetical protein
MGSGRCFRPSCPAPNNSRSGSPTILLPSDPSASISRRETAVRAHQFTPRAARLSVGGLGRKCAGGKLHGGQGNEPHDAQWRKGPRPRRRKAAGGLVARSPPAHDRIAQPQVHAFAAKGSEHGPQSRALVKRAAIQN